MSFKNSSLITTIALASLALSACGQSAQQTGDTPSPEPTATAEQVSSPSPSPSPKETSPSPSETTPPRNVNARGDLIKDFGEDAGIASTTHGSNDPDGAESWVSFTVHGVEEITCTHTYGAELLAEAGTTMVAIDLEVETFPLMTKVFEDEPYLEPVLNFGFDWVGFTSSGTRMNEIHTDASINCIDPAKGFPFEIGPAEHARGLIPVEVTERAGEVVFRPYWVDSGWTWAYDLDEDPGMGA